LSPTPPDPRTASSLANVGTSTTEAIGRGHEVTAVIHERRDVDGKPDRVTEADVFDPTAVAAAPRSHGA
jgi:putative NADH-flavin reductase